MHSFFVDGLFLDNNQTYSEKKMHPFISKKDAFGHFFFNVSGQATLRSRAWLARFDAFGHFSFNADGQATLRSRAWLARFDGLEKF